MSSLSQATGVESPTNTKIISTQDILLDLCGSVSHVLSTACHKPIRHAQLVQSIRRVSLKPDISGFVVFDGGFTGLVVLNFSAAAAMEVYRDYMLSMGMSESDLSIRYTADEVGDIVGELINQIVGNFINKVNQVLQTTVEQSQPKVLTATRQLSISIDAGLEEPVMRRVAFTTSRNNVFYLEYSMEQTEFVCTEDYQRRNHTDPDQVLDDHNQSVSNSVNTATDGQSSANGGSSSEDLLSELGL